MTNVDNFVISEGDSHYRKVGYTMCFIYNNASHVCTLLYMCCYFQPGAVNSDGYTPLGRAVKNEELNVVKYLITERNIDPKGTYI